MTAADESEIHPRRTAGENSPSHPRTIFNGIYQYELGSKDSPELRTSQPSGSKRHWDN